MAMNVSTDGPVRVVINMTPMIDVLLVLLIIFMAISPQTPQGMNAALPRNAAQEAVSEPRSAVVLVIAKDGRYTLNTEAVPADSLADRLTSVYSRRASRILFLKGAPELEFGTVASAIDTARSVNISQLALMPR